MKSRKKFNCPLCKREMLRGRMGFAIHVKHAHPHIYAMGRKFYGREIPVSQWDFDKLIDLQTKEWEVENLQEIVGMAAPPSPPTDTTEGTVLDFMLAVFPHDSLAFTALGFVLKMSEGRTKENAENAIQYLRMILEREEEMNG